MSEKGRVRHLPDMEKTTIEFLKGKSANELLRIAAAAADLANDLAAAQPSYELALLHGVEDCSYETVRHGLVASYAGEATIIMADGRPWRAIGHGPTGNAHWVERAGWIEFIPMADYSVRYRPEDGGWTYVISMEGMEIAEGWSAGTAAEACTEANEHLRRLRPGAKLPELRRKD
jgi:hypothetical protein